MRPRIGAAAAAIAVLAGCATIGRVDLADESCAESFRSQIASILVAQGEDGGEARALGKRTVLDLGYRDPGPRPFVVRSRTTDYTFFVQQKKSGCLLRLLRREREFATYTNDVTFIETRRLPGCSCASE
ncbi:MAG TPA: hypothetical protein VFS34_08190 [Thermoanaerobaculia bacterium]|nr:hypothetical protein [Thermoanaerobaculia bacterium]